jgi:hypothetical protein
MMVLPDFMQVLWEILYNKGHLGIVWRLFWIFSPFYPIIAISAIILTETPFLSEIAVSVHFIITSGIYIL